jgi:hypothetical protein
MFAMMWKFLLKIHVQPPPGQSMAWQAVFPSFINMWARR